jgi:hypothetical protein
VVLENLMRLVDASALKVLRSFNPKVNVSSALAVVQESGSMV